MMNRIFQEEKGKMLEVDVDDMIVKYNQEKFNANTFNGCSKRSGNIIGDLIHKNAPLG